MEGNFVARLHHYVKPGDRIGGSGKPDPKVLTIDGITYRAPKHGDPESPRLTNGRINEILKKQGIAGILTYPRGYVLKVKKFYHLTIRTMFVKIGLAEDR